MYCRREWRCLRHLLILLSLLLVSFVLYLPHFDYKQRPVWGWEPEVSRDARIYIKPDNETWLFGGKECCDDETSLVVVVTSAPHHFTLRVAIRETWGSFNSSKYKLKFLLGIPSNLSYQEKLNLESAEYGDIVQENFMDTYNNLTLKSLMMLKWYVRCCPKAMYLLKSDDDMFINISNLERALQKSPTTNFLAGNLICRSRPYLSEKSKWYTPKYIYPHPFYPNYLSGTAYLMSRDVAEKLYKVAFTIPLLHLEDVFLTGMCAAKARVRPRNNKGFTYDHVGRACRAHLISNHEFTPTAMYEAWKDTGSGDNCSHPFVKTSPRPSTSKAFICG